MGLTPMKQRWTIVVRWQEVQNVRVVSRELGVDERTVQQWVDRFAATGDVQDNGEHACMQWGGKPWVSIQCAASRYHNNHMEPHVTLVHFLCAWVFDSERDPFFYVF